jgi:hypothetical protein
MAWNARARITEFAVAKTSNHVKAIILLDMNEAHAAGYAPPQRALLVMIQAETGLPAHSVRRIRRVVCDAVART